MKTQQARFITAFVGILAVSTNIVANTSQVVAKDFSAAQINLANNVGRSITFPSEVSPPTTIAEGQRFAAFVHSESLNRYSTSWGFQTRGEATLEAMRKCFQQGATDCQLVTTYTTYGVIVRAQNGYSTWVVDNSREDAEKKALTTCLNESPFPSTCKVVISRSARGDQAYGFNPIMPQPQVFAGR